MTQLQIDLNNIRGIRLEYSSTFKASYFYNRKLKNSSWVLAEIPSEHKESQTLPQCRCPKCPIEDNAVTAKDLRVVTRESENEVGTNTQPNICDCIFCPYGHVH